MGSVVLPHLTTGWHVDQAILSEEDRLVVIRFGRDSDPQCMSQDEVLFKIADRVKNFAVSTCSLANRVLPHPSIFPNLCTFCLSLSIVSSASLHARDILRGRTSPSLTAHSPHLHQFYLTNTGYLRLRSRRSARLQSHVRALRCLHGHVLLPQQAHDVRFWHGQQQQAQLGA